jgi:hypothetical protein
VDVPLAVKPVSEVGFAVADHEKVAPATFEARFTKLVGLPEQTIWVNGAFDTAGFGLTVITWVIEVPWQPFAVGIIVMVTVPAVFPELFKTQAGIGFKVPLACAPEIPLEETVVQL